MSKKQNQFVGSQFSGPYEIVPCCICGGNAKMPADFAVLAKNNKMMCRCLRCQKDSSSSARLAEIIKSSLACNEEGQHGD
jgi:hypothetical protein